MPIAVTMYKCEKCGALFQNEGYATACEESHIRPVQILVAHYAEESELPALIDVRLEDHSVIQYQMVVKDS